jgi:flagella basal body P-ring formation protein FlgA|uniref:flagellar basal body P-ring formation chaperone FlgA n=1 Tax=Yoonia sp. TaxID=2212373 RepID=UPI00404706DB|tara:strand:+ start:50266 stop:50682 length:417 start_codon:yes stop_codon:yes gene_type:complete
MIRLIFLLGLLASPAISQTVVAARTIPAQTLIGPEDLALRDGTVVGGESDPLLFVGMESRVALYAGRPIRAADVGFPAVIERNQIVPLLFKRGGVTIATEGRSLGRAGPGETVRIMNLASRSTVSARVGADGVAYVSQ